MDKVMSSQSMQGNKFTLYIGVVLEDKQDNVDSLKVQLSELTPYIEGAVEPKVAVKQVGDNSSGYKSSVETTNVIEADYFNLITNRRYPPDVKKNELVFIFNYADTDTYYWYPIGRMDNLRRTERLTFSICDLATPPDSIDEENSYTFEMDTKNEKRILLQTSNSDGEQFKYLIKIDAKANTITIGDNNNNVILLDSNVPRIFLRNTNGAHIDLSGNNAIVCAPEDVIIRGGRQIVLDAPVWTTRDKAGSGGCVIECKNFAVHADSSVVLKSPSVGANGAFVADTVVTDFVQSGSYNTGGKGSNYTPTESNIKAGTATTPGNSPNSGGGGESNRYCSAWDQVEPMTDNLAKAIEKLAAKIQVDVSGETSNARQLASQSKMLKNRGE